MPDKIIYTTPFRENVGGTLKACFRLDARGEPQFEPYPGDRRRRVYTIDVFLDTRRAHEIKRVKYYLDDSTFEEPEGYSEDVNNQFRTEIESYGDVEIVVTVTKTDGNKYEQRAWLSHMLENGHAEDETPAAAQRALAHISVF